MWWGEDQERWTTLVHGTQLLLYNKRTPNSSKVNRVTRWPPHTPSRAPPWSKFIPTKCSPPALALLLEPHIGNQRPLSWLAQSQGFSEAHLLFPVFKVPWSGEGKCWALYQATPWCMWAQQASTQNAVGAASFVSCRHPGTNQQAGNTGQPRRARFIV